MIARRVRCVLIVAATLVLAAVTSPAEAAPQILALLETPAPMPMVCAGGSCTAELSTICLEKHRQMPVPGTPYRAASPEHVRVVLTARDGQRTTLDAGRLAFRSTRGYSAVEVTVPRAVLAGRDVVSAEVSVARLATVVPVPAAGDERPITAAELARATGLRRMAALRAEHMDAPLVTAARAADRLLNGAAEDWTRLARDLGVAPDDAGIRQAQEIAATCHAYADQGGKDGYGGCLRFRHDGLMDQVNGTYYRRTDVGS